MYSRLIKGMSELTKPANSIHTMKRDKKTIVDWHLENKQMFGSVLKKSKRKKDQTRGNSKKDNVSIEKEIILNEKYKNLRAFILSSLLKQSKLLGTSKVLPPMSTPDFKQDNSVSGTNNQQDIEINEDRKTSKAEFDKLNKSLSSVLTYYKSVSSAAIINDEMFWNVAQFLNCNQQRLLQPDTSLFGLNKKEIVSLGKKPKYCKHISGDKGKIDSLSKKSKQVKNKSNDNGEIDSLTNTSKLLENDKNETALTKKSVLSVPSHQFYKDRYKEDITISTLPFYNIWKHKSKEEAIQYLESVVQKQFDLDEKIVCSSFILEKTSPDPKIDNQSLSFKNDDLKIIERNLKSYLLEDAEVSSESSLQSEVYKCLKFLKNVFKNVSEIVGQNVETRHPVLGYTATADIICTYNDSLVLVDWKSQLRMPFAETDSLLQVAACIGALNFDPNIKFQSPIKRVILIVGYGNGKRYYQVNLKEIALTTYWSQWMERWERFQQLRLKDNSS